MTISRKRRLYPIRVKGSHPEAGFTLLEMALVLVVLSLIVGSITTVMSRSNFFSEDYTRHLVIEQNGWRLMDFLTGEIQQVDPASVEPFAMPDDWIKFNKVEGVNSSGYIVGDKIRILYQAAAGETAGNAVDDNGDGRVDEGFIQYETWDADVGQTLVDSFRLADNILSLSFGDLGGSSQIEISFTMALVDRDGNLISRTFTERVTFRNP